MSCSTPFRSRQSPRTCQVGYDQHNCFLPSSIAMRAFYSVVSVVLFIASSTATPVAEPDFIYHELARPFVNNALSNPRASDTGFSIFRRQGSCPILTLVCPSGICCSYDKPCCGSTCCDSLSVCSGIDSRGAPCCVPLSSATNTCGSSGNVSLPRLSLR